MLWFYGLVIAVTALALWFYAARRRARHGGREGVFTEASAEIGIPSEAVNRERTLLADRMAGVRRPQVTKPRDEREEDAPRTGGPLRERDLRRGNLSKEVELDWEASSLMERQPWAYAHPRDFRDEPSKGFLRRTEQEYVLPERYGKDRLVLMARDPRWIYAYWEIANERRRELRERRLSQWGLSRPVLRLYDMTEPSSHGVLDIELQDEADNWYVRVDRPRHRFVAEVGRAFPDGFVALARSNEVFLPPESPSMEMAEEWAFLSWERNYGRFTAAVGVSSPGVWSK